MNSKANYIAVGLFVIVLSAAFAAGILWISTGGPHQAYDRYVVYMTGSVAGVSRDGAVKYRGVDVGKVVELALDRENPQRVRVLLKIEQGTPIKEDTVATLEMQGLTGLAHISLLGGSLESPPLRAREGEEFPVIDSKPSRLEELGVTASKLLAVLTDTADRLNSLLNDANQDKVGQTLGNLEALTSTLAKTVAGQSENLTAAFDDFSATMRNARQASTHLPALIGRFEQSAVAIEGMANDIAAAGVGLNKAISSSSQQVDRFTSEALSQTGLLVDELRQAARSLRRLSQQLESDPSLLLYGTPQPKPGPGE